MVGLRTQLMVLLCWWIHSTALVQAATFLDVTASVAPNLVGGKVAWGDFNNDGFVDFNALGSVFRNVRGKRFGLVANTGVNRGGIWGDFDNDQWLDFFSYTSRTLHRNLSANSSNSFAPFALPALPPSADTSGASWGDHNNDGFLDLYVGGYESPGTYDSDIILTNNQGTSFSHTWTQPVESIVTPGQPMPARGITSADFDRDGDIDIYVSNYRIEPNQLRVNDGNGNFTDEAATRGVQGDRWYGAWGHSIGSVWGDFDNDGEIDIFTGHFAHPAGQFGCCPDRQVESQFFKNLGQSAGYTFQDMGQGGVQWQESYATPTAGDYDNDGHLDLFFTTVYGGDAPRLYRNEGNFNFTNITSSANLGGIGPTYQAAFADYDNDGDLDLVTGGRFFENQGNNNHWLKLKLVGDGTAISRDAVGAQVRIEVGGQTLTRQVEFGTGEGNQNDPTLHFGLGSNSGPVDLEIMWPGGATEQRTNIAIDQLHVLLFHPPVDGAWNLLGTGSWKENDHWGGGVIPNANTTDAILGSSIVANATVTVDNAVTVKSLTFANTNRYVIAGSSSITLDAGDGLPTILVEDSDQNPATAEHHELKLPVRFADPTTITTEAGTSLDFDDEVHLNGNQVTIAPGSSVRFHHSVIPGSGGAINNSGTLGGTAGSSLGRDLTSSGSLAVEISGHEHTRFTVGGTANLEGTIEVSLADSFIPSNGQTFVILSAGTLYETGAGIELATTGDAPLFSLLTLPGDGGTLTLSYSPAVPEPATGMLVVLAAALLGLAARRPGARSVGMTKKL